MKVVTAFLDFHELRKIGNASAFGEVWEAHDPQLSTNIAVKKVLKPDGATLANPNLFAEAQRLQSCRHDNVVEIKYGCQDKDAIYFAMPFYGKGSLQDILNARFLTVREVIRYGIDILTGLQHIHTQRLLHLDIKPANILIADDGRALVGDFGCAREIKDDNLAESGAMYPLHLVPEKFTSKQVALEADIYLVGLTLFRMCNGDRRFFDPIQGRKTPEEIKDVKIRNKINEKIKKGKFPNRDFHLPHIPSRLKKAITKALHMEPSKRFPSAHEFSNALAEVNTCLDWQYSEEATGVRKWVFTEGGDIVVATITPNGPLFDVETVKTTKATGKPFHRHEFCAKKFKMDEAESLITRLVRTVDPE